MISIFIILLVFFILGSALLSASETALFSLSPMKIRMFKQRKDFRSQIIGELLSHPQKLLVTILMLNVFMNILVQNVVSGIFGLYSSWWLSVGIPLVITLLFGEVVPKAVAYAKNAWIAYHVAPLLRAAAKILRPIRDCITFVTEKISRLTFFYLRKEKEISTDELKFALKTSKEYGVLSEEEAKLVRGYLNLRESLVKEIMCPRQEILFFDINHPINKLVHLFVEEECTRIPVCNKTLENLLGIITSGSFFLHRDHINTSYDLIPFLRKPHFIPESRLGRALLEQFYEEEETMMIVVDEYGSISGLITLEDVVEIVIGQIADRRKEKSYYTRASEDVVIASGKLQLVEFEELFDVHLESLSNMATIGGWLTEQIGDIPKSGYKYVTDQFLFHILSSDVNRIRRVYIRRLTRPKKGK